METCKVDGCKTKLYAKGYCYRHWQQIRRSGHILKRTRHDPNEFIFDGGMVKIILYDKWSKKCGEAIIDADDYDLVKDHKWCLLKNGNYCVTHINGKVVMIQHVLVNNKKIDHIDRNGLNNRRCNLRECTHQQNNCNKGPQKNCKSGLKGVFLAYGKWRAQIGTHEKRKDLGTFDTKKQAAIAYNKEAKKLHGEFAYLNPV